MDEDCVVSSETHISEIVFVFLYCRSVCVDAFTSLWCTFALEEASAGVLGSSLDGFSLDGINNSLGGYVLEGFVVIRGFN